MIFQVLEICVSMHYFPVRQVAQAAANRVKHSANLFFREDRPFEPRDRHATFPHIADLDLVALSHCMEREGVHKLAVELQREAKDFFKLRRDIEHSQMGRQPRNYNGQVDVKPQEQ